MADTQLSETAYLKLYNRHAPQLDSGRYTLSVEQRATALGATWTASREFYIQGERLAFPAALIGGHFPADRSQRNSPWVLPHVVLNRGTLPWERHIRPGSTAPWLALLLVDAGEQSAATLRAGTLADLGPDFQPEPGETAESPVSLLEIERQLLERILPAETALDLLAHVRVDADGREQAILIGNRLPRPDSTATVYLVALEHRFDTQGFKYGTAGPTDRLRLVCLKSWSYAVDAAGEGIAEALLRLDPDQLDACHRLQEGHAAARGIAEAGFMPFRHLLRNGDTRAAFYRGPLVPATLPAQQTPTQVPVLSADMLLRYVPAHKLLDVSYAAAWTLGRLLALQSMGFQQALLGWKNIFYRRAKAQLVEQKLRDRGDERLFRQAFQLGVIVPAGDFAVPEPVVQAVSRWLMLDGVPFIYFVPEAGQLPPESIRFFRVDGAWMSALLDGICSPGRTVGGDAALQLEADLTRRVSEAVGKMVGGEPFHGGIAGCLIRSLHLRGLEQLQVVAHVEGKEVQPLRTVMLSDDIQLILFSGAPANIEVTLPPTAMHAGFEPPANAGEGPGLQLRGEESAPPKALNRVAMRPASAPGVLDIPALADDIAASLSIPSTDGAMLACQLMESRQSVLFELSGDAGSD